MSDSSNDFELSKYFETVGEGDFGMVLKTAYAILDDIRSLMGANYRAIDAAILTPPQLADYRNQTIVPTLHRLQVIEAKNEQQRAQPVPTGGEQR